MNILIQKPKTWQTEESKQFPRKRFFSSLTSRYKILWLFFLSLVVLLPYFILLLQNKYFGILDSGLWFLDPVEFLKSSLSSWYNKINFGLDQQTTVGYFYWQILAVCLNLLAFGKTSLFFFLFKSVTLLIGFWGFFLLIRTWQKSLLLCFTLSFCFLYSLIPFTEMHLFSLFSEQVYYTLPITVVLLYRYLAQADSRLNTFLVLLILSLDLLYLPNIAFLLGYIAPYGVVFFYLLHKSTVSWRIIARKLLKLLFYFTLLNLWIFYSYLRGITFRYNSAIDIVNPIQNFLATENTDTPYLGFTGSNILVLARSGIQLGSWVVRVALIQIVTMLGLSSYSINLQKGSQKLVALSLLGLFLVFFIWSAGSNFSLWGVIQIFTAEPNFVVSIFRGPEGKLGPTVFISLLLLVSFVQFPNSNRWLLTILLVTSPLCFFLLLLNQDTFNQPGLNIDTNVKTVISIKPAYSELKNFLNNNVSPNQPVLRLPLSTFDIVQVKTYDGDYLGADFSRYLFKNPFIFSYNYQQPTDTYLDRIYGAIINKDFDTAFNSLRTYSVNYILIDNNIEINSYVANNVEYANVLGSVQDELNTRAKKLFMSQDGSLSLYLLNATPQNPTSSCLPVSYSSEWHLFNWNIGYLIQNFWTKPYNKDGFTCFGVSTIPGIIYFDDVIRIILMAIGYITVSLLSIISLFRKKRYFVSNDRAELK